MHHSQIPRTKVENKDDKFWHLANSLILYLQLCTFGRQRLAAEKRLDQKTDFRLLTEQNLCLNLLLNASGLSKTIIMTASHAFVYDDTGKVRPEFEEELKRFCDTTVPPRPTIISGPALNAEMQRLMATRKR